MFKFLRIVELMVFLDCFGHKSVEMFVDFGSESMSVLVSEDLLIDCLLLKKCSFGRSFGESHSESGVLFSDECFAVDSDFGNTREICVPFYDRSITSRNVYYLSYYMCLCSQTFYSFVYVYYQTCFSRDYGLSFLV